MTHADELLTIASCPVLVAYAEAVAVEARVHYAFLTVVCVWPVAAITCGMAKALPFSAVITTPVLVALTGSVDILLRVRYTE